MAEKVSKTIQRWSSGPDISARSVLVTIFGDSILPVAKDVWLSELFELTEPFGFSQRLIRTSLFRLAGDGWIANERVGRRSQYVLTAAAVGESEDAEGRIYRNDDPTWDGTWTVAIVGAPTVPVTQRDQLARSLSWHGFVPLGRGIFASTVRSPAGVREFLGEADLPVPPLMVGSFHDLEDPASVGIFANAIATPELQSSYTEFVSFYQRLLRRNLAAIDAIEAFALRTMLVHDLRRIRLRTPDLPTSVMPGSWIGHDAYSLAGDLYTRLSPGTAEALSTILGSAYPPVFGQRFPKPDERGPDTSQR